MEMRTDKFMIYVFSAIMLGGMVACSSDDPETDTGNGNGNGGNAEAPYVWGTEGAIKTCDHLLFNDDKTENAKGTVIGNGDQEFIFKGTQKRKAWHILNRMENVGGDLNAYTNKEETVIYSAFLTEHFGRAFELLADIVFHSTFP